ncbi:MAG: DUF6029 family protein [Flavobacteriales bacterium]
MKKKLALATLTLFSHVLLSQNLPAETHGQLHGNFQILAQQYNEDTLIGAQVPDAGAALNAYGNLTYNYGAFTAGVRFEHYMNAVLGFPGRFKGTGLGSRYIRYNNDGLDITVGNFYEQFGNGMALRSYWEPNLGIDNALDGVRVLFNPYRGIYLKGLFGQQRFDFDSRLINADGIVRGVDGEINLNEFLPQLDSISPIKITLGGSFVSKYEAGETVVKDNQVLILPANVCATSFRAKIQFANFQINGEYITKINDPNADNGFIYKEGKGILLNAGYSAKGIGVSLNAKFIDNMAFRSSRNALLFDVPINYLPAITRQHTYNLAATLYPYATVLNGESGLSGELFYNIKKGTLLGGATGASLNINVAAVNSLDTLNYSGLEQTVMGYKTNSYLFGKTKFVRDINIEVKKKISKEWSMTAVYYYFEFNTLATPVTQDFKGIVYANIGVLDLQYKMNKKQTIRSEFQALLTKQDKGDWATVLMEYSYSPHWIVSVIDQYNYGNPDADKRVHYLFGSMAYAKGSSRISLGYGKRRAGIFCIGGVCRAVPASNGIELTITSSF